jgi:hypothetical protein
VGGRQLRGKRPRATVPLNCAIVRRASCPGRATMPMSTKALLIVPANNTTMEREIAAL